MDISTSLLAKGAAGALATTAAISGGVLANNNGLFNGIFGANVEEDKNSQGEKRAETETREDNLEDARKPAGTDGNPSEQPAEPTDPGSGGSSVGNGQVQPSTTDTVSEDPNSQGARSRMGDGLQSGDAVLHSIDRSASETQGTKKELTKFDQGLIDFLGAGGDIVFEVKKGGNKSEDFTEADLTFNSSNKALPITAKVSVDTGNSTNLIEKTDSEDDEKGKRATIQKLNKTDATGTPWTWTCKVKLKTSETSLDGKTINDKDKIFSSANSGLFNLLKKNISGEADETAKEKLRGIKEKFIKSCAGAREDNDDIESKETLDNNKLESTITINLKLGVTGQTNKTDTGKFYPCGGEDDRKFKELFGEATAQQST